jgi:hypothetical protein
MFTDRDRGISSPPAPSKRLTWQIEFLLRIGKSNGKERKTAEETEESTSLPCTKYVEDF